VKTNLLHKDRTSAP